MALFQSDLVSNVIAPLPLINTTPTGPTNPADPVTLTLTGGDDVLIFESLAVALQCMEKMRLSNQQTLELSADIIVISVAATKLIVAQRTRELVLLFASFAPVYYGGLLLFAHRGNYSVVSLERALTNCGVLVIGLLSDNAALKNAGLPLQFVDINYQQAGLPTSSAVDNPPLQYAYVS